MVAKDVAAPQTQSQEIASARHFDTETLRDMQSIDDALAALSNAGIPLRDVSDIGDGFEMLTDAEKSQLVGVKFVILDAQESEGDYGKSFVIVRLMTKDARKCIVTDGSTGIRDQLVNDVIPRFGTAAGLVVENGLRASEFKYCEECKKVSKLNATACTHCGHSPIKPATTYYLDTSK